MKRKKLLYMFMFVLLSVLVLAACGDGDADVADSDTADYDTAETDDGETNDDETDDENGADETDADNNVDGDRDIVIAFNNNILTLNPFESRTALDNNVIAAMAESLIDFDENMELIGRLAESFEVSDDSLTHTFNLRQGIYFHDGEYFDAYAVLANVNFVLDEGEGAARWGTFRTIEEVNVIDQYTFEFIHNEPFMPFLERLQPFRIVSPAQIESGDLDSGPIGTGQFIFREWVDGDRMVMDRNPDWRDADQIGVDSITYRFVPENATRVAMLQSGEADIVYPMPHELLAQIEGDNNFYVEVRPSTVMRFVMMNQDVEPLDNLYVRRAMNYAIDVEAYAQVVRGGFSSPASSPISELLPFHYASDMYDHSVDTANDLLDEAGFPKGDNGVRFSLTLWASTDTTEIRAMEFLAQQWELVGIDVLVEPMEEGTLSDSIWGQTRETTEMNMWYVSWSAFDPDNALRSPFMSTMHTPAGANANFYTNYDVDEAIMAGNAAPTFEERYEYYAFAQRQIVEDAVWIFLGADDRIVARSARITGGGLQPTGNWLDLRTISVD